MKKLQDLLFDLFNVFFFHFYLLTRNVADSAKNIAIKDFGKDFASLVLDTGMLAVINLLAFVLFVFLPPGRDILLIIAEEVGATGEHQYGSLLWLVVGLLFWSIVSEFACRYSIYVSDNSGKSLSDERVLLRKNLQKILSSFYLVFPYIIILTTFAIDYFDQSELRDGQRNIGFGIPALIIYLEMNIVGLFYFGRRHSKHIKVQDEKQQNATISEQSDEFSPLFTARSKIFQTIAENIARIQTNIKDIIGLRPEEQLWCNKLFGIYNDFVFTLRKPENFSGETQKEYEIWRHNHVLAYGLTDNQKDFPRDSKLVGTKTLVPDDFVLQCFEIEDGNNGQMKWEYYIPNSFYTRLHRQVLFIALTSVVIFITIPLLNIPFYEIIGSTGLVMLAFTSWTGIYIGLLYLDFAVFRVGTYKAGYKEICKMLEGKSKEEKRKIKNKNKRKNAILGAIPIRLLLTIIIILSSFVNYDHPVRYNESGLTDNRPKLNEHFIRWRNTYLADTSNFFRENGNDSPVICPITFVCAEGGASRTGAFAAMLLSSLQDHFAKQHGNFKNSIYAYSGVSGGSLGLAFFNSVAYLQDRRDLLYADSLRGLTTRFFARDFLAPVVGKLFFGEVINWLLPFHIKQFDRAIALEKSWETGYEVVLKQGRYNHFSHDFLSAYTSGHSYPALFINTTEAENGKQCWMSNVVPDSSMIFAAERDVVHYRLHGGVNLSTAINFSSRFPLISPAATLIEDDNDKEHYVDGGYSENSGAATMLEILMAIRQHIDTLLYMPTDSARAGTRPRRIFLRPYVLILRFGDDSLARYPKMDFANEISEIIYGIYNARVGRTDMAIEQLRRFVEDSSLKGRVCELKLRMSNNQVPTNWVLSEKSLSNIRTWVQLEINEYKKNQLQDFYLFDTIHLKPLTTSIVKSVH